MVSKPNYNDYHPDKMSAKHGAESLFNLMVKHMPYPDLEKDRDRAIFCALHTVGIRLECHQYGEKNQSQYNFWKEIGEILKGKLSVEEKRRKSLEILLSE
jgi:hypothetical protein